MRQEKTSGFDLLRVENPNPMKPKGFELSNVADMRQEKTSGFDLLRVENPNPMKPKGFEVASRKRSRQDDDPPAILLITPLLNRETTAG
jgi:hypothetical protein